MRCSLAAGVIWLVFGARAVALAPAADLELTPMADLESTWPASKELHAVARAVEEGVESVWKRPGAEPQPAPRMTVELARELNAAAQAAEAGEHAATRSGSRAQVSPQHSHAVLRKLIAAAPARQLNEFELEAQIASDMEAAPAPPSEAPNQPPRPEPQQQRPARHSWRRQARRAPPPEPLSGWGRSAPGGDFCAGRPIYDGPTTNWEDCRRKCTGTCRFWSYWQDSTRHRCKLTTDCGRHEKDDRHDVVVHWMAQKDAVDKGDDQAARADAQASSNLQDLQTCSPRGSPRGSARRFAASPQGGWHDAGTAHSYVDCANATRSMGYRNLVWNVGSAATGRCYGVASDVPDIRQPACEDTYCWLFGPACEPAGQGAEQGQNLVAAAREK